MKKKNFYVFIIKGVLIISIIITILYITKNNNNTLKQLPTPEITNGIRGEQFGIDKNINEETIDNYLNRNDSVYRDVRMLIDPGNYEAIGGDSYLSGFIAGFEVVPLPYLVNVSNLPEDVGDTYTGNTLYTQTENGKYIANYKESLQILEYLFPKDKYIFLICGGGGYAGMTKNLLTALGWNENKIYNVGGYWYYEGENKVEVKNTSYDDVTYDFWKVAYHNIEFDTLHLIEK
ncbi:MAG: hypothetical protein Q4G04_01900 [bacterium]|nr:hypothetical protein [bacterium]